MNSVNLIGRLTKDPSLKKLDGGEDVCAFVLAVDDRRAKDDRADFIGVTASGSTAVLCKKYLREGFMVGVTGRLMSRNHYDSPPRGVEPVAWYPMHVIADDVRFLQWPERSGE